jgi:hypothetical protein
MIASRRRNGGGAAGPMIWACLMQLTTYPNQRQERPDTHLILMH